MLPNLRHGGPAGSFSLEQLVEGSFRESAIFTTKSRPTLLTRHKATSGSAAIAVCGGLRCLAALFLNMASKAEIVGQRPP
jgi:hypothetical protein